MSVGSELLVESEASLGAVELVPAEVTARSPWQLFWRRFRGDRVAMVSLVFIILLILVALFAGPLVNLFGVTGPNQQNLGALDVFGQPTGPSGAHPFGVDELGRDILARVIYGAQVSLEVAFISTGIAVVIGVAIGTAAGYFRGWVDTVLARLMDIVLAFPILLLAIGLAAACSLGKGCLGGLITPGRVTLIVVIALSSWPYIGRIIRGQVLSLREKEFVEAARSLGASNTRIMSREILPNLVAPAAHRQLGADDRFRIGHVRHGLVVHGLSGRRASADRSRVQPRRRRAAGRSEPEGRALVGVSPDLKTCRAHQLKRGGLATCVCLD